LPPIHLILITIFRIVFASAANALELNPDVAKLLDNRGKRTEEQIMNAINKLDSMERTYVLQQGVLLFASNQKDFQRNWLLIGVFGLYACSEKEILEATNPFVDSTDVRLRKYINNLRTKEELEDVMTESKKVQKEFEARIVKSDLADKFQGRLIRCDNEL